MLDPELQQHIDQRRATNATVLADLLDGREHFTWEVGCGKGHFLKAYAEAFADRFSIGVDLISKRLHDANRIKSNSGLENVHFLNIEAYEFLECLPQGCQMDHIFVLFPDPWPKKRHHNRRLIQPEFLSSLAKQSTSDALFYFRTDDEDYFAWTVAHLETHEDWVITEEVLWPLDVDTTFQKKMDAYQSVIARGV